MLFPPNTERILATPRLILEPLRTEHARALFPWLQDARLYEWIPQEPPETSEALAKRYADLEKRRSPDGKQLWLNWMMRTKESGAGVGTLQATVFDDASSQIAYFVFPPFWRQGLAKEGCRRILRLLFTEFKIQTAFAELDTRNAASQALLESLDFVRTKETPNAATFKGSVSHEYRYELSRERSGCEVRKTSAEA